MSTLTDEESDFNDSLAKEGGIFVESKYLRVDLQFYRQRAQGMLKAILTNPTFKNPPKIYFNFINNDTYNACSGRSIKGMYLVGINVGLLALTRDIFARSVSLSDFLLHIGDPTKEQGKKKHLRRYYTSAIQMAHAVTPAGQMYALSTIVDPVRLNFVDYLLDIVFDFILGHEIYHLLHGHYDYLNSIRPKGSNSLTTLNECFLFTCAKDQVPVVRALEIDADSSSVMNGLIYEIRKFTGRAKFFNEHAPFYKSIREVLFNYSFAIQTAMRIMAEGDSTTGSEQFEQDHPHPRIRQAMIVEVLEEKIAEMVPNFVDDKASPLQDRVLTEVESIFIELTGSLPDGNVVGEIFDMVDGIGKNYNSVMKKIYGDLMKYSFSPRGNQFQ